jgi:hypothetical protein
MLQGLSEFVIKVADLAEAEGRHLRSVVTAILVGFALILASACVLVIAVGLLVLAVYSALSEVLGPAWGALAAALAAGGGAVLLAFIGLRMMSKTAKNGGAA